MVLVSRVQGVRLNLLILRGFTQCFPGGQTMHSPTLYNFTVAVQELKRNNYLQTSCAMLPYREFNQSIFELSLDFSFPPTLVFFLLNDKKSVFPMCHSCSECHRASLTISFLSDVDNSDYCYIFGMCKKLIPRTLLTLFLFSRKLKKRNNLYNFCDTPQTLSLQY